MKYKFDVGRGGSSLAIDYEIIASGASFAAFTQQFIQTNRIKPFVSMEVNVIDVNSTDSVPIERNLYN
jgi:hypothetical protein